MASLATAISPSDRHATPPIGRWIAPALESDNEMMQASSLWLQQSRIQDHRRPKTRNVTPKRAAKNPRTLTSWKEGPVFSTWKDSRATWATD